MILGHATQVGRDKFLVMSTEIKEGLTTSETAAVWKTAPKSSILEHRYPNTPFPAIMSLCSCVPHGHLLRFVTALIFSPSD